MKAIFRTINALACTGLLLSCGGVTLEAKMANAIQTIMSNSAEAFLLNDAESGDTITFNCSSGGSLSYSGDFDLIDFDPLDGASTGSASFPMIISNCKIDVCGDTFTFETGGTANLIISGLNPADIIGGEDLVGNENKFFQLELIITDQPVSGFLQGTMSFAYKMRIVGSTAGLSEIEILDSDSGEPAKLPSGPIPASSLEKLADRC
ncbi:hypothetical protein GW915_12950 [bacterium]|nr:hypothetical protein [bacterium]